MFSLSKPSVLEMLLAGHPQPSSICTATSDISCACIPYCQNVQKFCHLSNSVFLSFFLERCGLAQIGWYETHGGASREQCGGQFGEQRSRGEKGSTGTDIRITGESWEKKDGTKITRVSPGGWGESQGGGSGGKTTEKTRRLTSTLLVPKSVECTKTARTWATRSEVSRIRADAHGTRKTSLHREPEEKDRNGFEDNVKTDEAEKRTKGEHEQATLMKTAEAIEGQGVKKILEDTTELVGVGEENSAS